MTVAHRNPPYGYYATVLRANPDFFWTLGQLTGRTATDASAHHFNGIYEPGTTKGVHGPIHTSRATATAFDGHTGLVTAGRSILSPDTFSIEAWFKTSTKHGGKIIGFGSKQTGMSRPYDRHIYMMNDGQIVFGVWNNATETIESPDVYNDGQWHYVVATLSASGMALYVDGRLIGRNTNNVANNYTGYWRVGGDNLGGWNLDLTRHNSMGVTEPGSYYFGGTIADVAVYPYALSGRQIAAHYAANIVKS